MGATHNAACDCGFSTVFRFKGQAADAVIITEIDFEQFGNRERRRLFVALSRARLQAVLITTARAAEILQGRLNP